MGRRRGKDHWFNLYSDDSGVTFGAMNGGTVSSSVKADYNTNLSNNTWHLVTGVAEDLGNGTTAIRIYVDGVLRDEHIATSTFNTPSSCRFYIGPYAQNSCTGTDADEFAEFRGPIDDARVYSHALTHAEVEMLYLATP